MIYDKPINNKNFNFFSVKTYIKKTYIKYIYKYPNELTSEIVDIKELVDNLSEKVLKQNEQLCLLDSLTKKCDILTNSTICLETKHDKLESEFRNNCNRPDDNRRINESIDEISRILKRNDEKIKDIELKITSMNGKIKKIIKYLNFD